MLIKSIRCQVADEKKESFSRGQTEWQLLSHVDGFLGQVGGWCEQDPNMAWIVAFWESRTAYQHFMKEVHDKIFLESGQGKTYSSIQVDLFEMDQQPGQLAFFVKDFDVLKAEILDSAIMISAGKNNDIRSKASTLNELHVTCKIKVEEAWRVAPIPRGE